MAAHYLAIAGIVIIYMSAWFVVSLLAKRNDVADFAWGMGFGVVAWSSYIVGEPHAWPVQFINILVSIWGIRLATHIFLRNRGKKEDKRYAEMRAKWGKWTPLRAYFTIFIGQGVLLLLIATPVVIANMLTRPATLSWQWVGVFVWLLGFFFEVVGDFQLSQFIKNPRNHGQLMTSGLWKFSRHPNYFGEVTQWWGIFIIALSGTNSWLGIIGPLTITVLILKVSGIPILEKGMQERPGFTEYARRTSIFLPWPPKHS